MQSGTPAIQLDDVSLRFANGTEAIRNVSFTVASGEIVAILGPSGCGKSTVLNIISGLLNPSTGSVLIDGDDTSNRRGRFAYMPQVDGLLPWRTSQENAALLLEVTGVPSSEARRRAREMLKEFDLAEFADMVPSQLSGGMRQRVALIRTVLPGRDVLLDEPFGALDSITRSDLQAWLSVVHLRTHLSMVLVTHDIDEALLVSDHVYVLSPRPGSVVYQLNLPVARPRPPEWLLTREILESKRALLSALRSSSAGAA